MENQPNEPNPPDYYLLNLQIDLEEETKTLEFGKEFADWIINPARCVSRKVDVKRKLRLAIRKELMWIYITEFLPNREK